MSMAFYQQEHVDGQVTHLGRHEFPQASKFYTFETLCGPLWSRILWHYPFSSLPPHLYQLISIAHTFYGQYSQENLGHTPI